MAEAGETGGAKPAKKQRLAALDWFRFAAVALMIQGHTFYEVLGEGVKSERWYAWHGYVHGFTAPMFYFSSGLAFGLTTLRTLDAHARGGPGVRQRYERYLTLLLLGYGLSAGDFSLRGLLHSEGAAHEALVATNTLHVLGVTLFAVQALVGVLKTRTRLVAACAALLCTVVLAAPAAWRSDFPALPRFAAAYLTNRTGSLFPLLPWSGYVLAGVLVGHAILDADGRSLRPDLTRRLATMGAVLALLGKGLTLLRLDVFGEHNHWKTGPFFFAQRLGVVLLGFALLTAIEARSRGPRGKASTLVGTVAMETLAMYVGHLLVLYGTPWTVQGLKEVFHGSLGLAASSAVFAALFAAMIALAWAWHTMKARHGERVTRARRTVTVLLLLLYALNPGAPGGAPPRTPARGPSASVQAPR